LAALHVDRLPGQTERFAAAQSRRCEDQPQRRQAVGFHCLEEAAEILRVDQIAPAACTIRLGQRPQPVPLDPASWTVLQRSLAHREHLRTDNRHVMVTRGTKAHGTPASTAYVSHMLDACGVPPRMLRCTRLVDLVNTMDPKLGAAAFGMDPEGVMIYLADRVHGGLLPSDDNDGVVHSPELSGRR
jgi:hypothetical protein